MKKQKLISVAIIIIGLALPLVSWAGYREYSCDEQEDIPATEENCKACGSSRQYSDGMCIFAKCSAGKIQGYINGTGEPGCFDCSEPATIVTTSSACSQCKDANGTPTRTQRQSAMLSGKVYCSLTECPADTFRHNNGTDDESCIPCDSPKGVRTTKDQCDTCPNREYDATSSLCYLSATACQDRHGYLTSGGDCADCASTDEHTIMPGKESLCLGCDNWRFLGGSVCRVPCPEGTVPDSTATNSFFQCHSCLVSEPIQTPHCDACPERKVENDLCVLKTCGSDEFLTKNGDCVPCDILAPQDTDATLCTCSNREMVNDQCVLKTCPDGKFRDQNGTCFDCTVSDVIADTAETECAKCTNRELYGRYCIPRCATGTYRYALNECRSCDTVQEGTVTYNIQACTDCGFTPTQISSNSAYVCRKTCPAGQFNGGDGQCYTCDTTEIVRTSPEACAVCGDVREHQSGVCLLKTCPDGMFRGRKAGTAYDACYACDDISVDITSGECTQKCGNTRVLGKNNICYSCQELNPFDVADQTACEQCPNRTYTMTGKCALSQCPDNTFSVYENSAVSCYACDGTYYDLKSSDCLEKCGDQRVLVGEYCVKACQPGEFRNGQSCLSCDEQTYTTETTQAECDQCGDLREMVDGRCLFKCPDGQFRDQYGNCQQCTDTDQYYNTTATQCSRCNGIRTMKDDSCILTTCPDGYYRDDSGYYCSECERIIGATKDYQWVNAESACQQCGLSWVNNTCTKVVCTDTQFVGTDGRCHECSDQTSWLASSSQCAKCGSKRISVDNGSGNACILCDGTLENASLWGLDEATCTKCCRGTATYTDDGTCICGTLEEEWNCPSGSFAGMDDVSYSFQCYPCDISYDIWLPEADPDIGVPPNHGEQECLACGDRSVVYSYCRLATCGTGEFWDATAGTCHACTDTTSYPGVSQKACESCPNRTYVSGYGKSFCVFSGN